MVGDILQPTHLLFVLAIALLVLGPKRLPEVGRTLGSGIRDFRNALSGDSTSERSARPEPQWVEAPPEPSSGPEYEPPHEPEAIAQPAAIAMEPVPTDAPPQLMLTPQPAGAAEPATASSAPSQPAD